MEKIVNINEIRDITAEAIKQQVAEDVDTAIVAINNLIRAKAVLGVDRCTYYTNQYKYSEKVAEELRKYFEEAEYDCAIDEDQIHGTYIDISWSKYKV